MTTKLVNSEPMVRVDEWFTELLFRNRSPVVSQLYLVSTVAVGFILSVGFSRTYLGVHFLSDVLGGYLLGACQLIVGIVLSEWQRTNPSANFTS